MAKTWDVLVVGAGIVGTFHAYFAAQRGLRTLLVERDPAPRQATVRNFGIVGSGTIAPPGEWDLFARRTNELYRQLAAASAEDLTIRSTGALYVVETGLEDQVIREFADRAPGLGKRAQYLSAAEVLQAHPFVDPGYARGGLFFPDDLSVDPRRFIHLLLAQLCQRDALHFKPASCIVDIAATAAGCVARASDGTQHHCDRAIICSGTEYRLLFPGFFEESGLEICKIDLLRTRPQTQVKLPHPILSGLSVRRYPGFEVCPSHAALRATRIDPELDKWDIHLLFKQAEDGSVFVGDSHEYFSLGGPAAIGFDLHAAAHEAILAYGKRMIHLDDWSTAQSWAGYVMRHPRQNVVAQQVAPGVHVALGIAGRGITTAPGFAEANMARILESGK